MKLKLALVTFALLAVLAVAVIPVQANGFDEWGYNYNARVFNGWYGYYDRSNDGWVSGTGDARLVMKWSKDWTPMADEPVGAWCTNHWTWYSNDFEESTWYGFNTRVAWTDPGVIPSATYRIVEFLKIMRVGDNPDEWARYQAGGAYNAQWGDYTDGVPGYVVFQDVVHVYDVQTGELVASFNLCTTSPHGLGQPIFTTPLEL